MADPHRPEVGRRRGSLCPAFRGPGRRRPAGRPRPGDRDRSPRRAWVTTWQYGLLDRASPHLDAAVLGCAREGDLWAILMPDLSGRFLRDTPQNSPSPEMREMLPRFLDGLAGMHAEFWADPALDDPRLGLDDPRGLFQLSSPTFARQHLGKWDTWLLAGAVDGWGALQEALDDDAAAQARALIDDPQPLLEALGLRSSDLPFTAWIVASRNVLFPGATMDKPVRIGTDVNAACHLGRSSRAPDRLTS